MRYIFTRIKLIPLLISVVPFNKLRIILYKYVCRYNIGKNTFISMFSYIDSKKVKIGNKVFISPFVYFIGLNHINIEDKVEICGNNWIAPSRPAFNPDMFKDKSKNYIIIKESSNIQMFHYLDTTGGITIGRNCVIKGGNCIFLTSDTKTGEVGPIEIQDNSEIHPNVTLYMDTKIPSDSIVKNADYVIKKKK